MGLSIGVLCLPRNTRPVRAAATLAAFVMLASVPDAPLSGWGHDRYRVSHSVFVTGGLLGIAAAGLAVFPRLLRWLGGRRIAVAGAVCWISHLLLDCLYNHGLGLAMFWPLSDARLDLALPWFAVLGREGSPSPTHIYAVEGLFYGSLLLLCLAVRLGAQRLGRKC